MEIKTSRIIIAGGVSLLVLLSAGLGFTGLLKQRSNSTQYSSWMKNISDSTSLRDINMPGSHDTMALYSIANLAGQCQTLSLKDQLNLGVRFLDIRLKEDHNKLKAVHGFVDQRASFDSVTATIENFIKDNPSEMIIMSVKEEADPSSSDISFEDSLKQYLTSNIYYLNKELPSTLGEVRGKVILLSRYGGSSIGVPAYDGWKDSCSFVLPNDIYVQDTYKISSTSDKKDEIVKCFNEAGHSLKINFLSAYKPGGFPPSYAPSSANDINPWINEEISKYNDRGIVLYDYVTEGNMQAFFKGVL